MKLSMKIKSQPWIEWRVQENLCLLLNTGGFLSEHLKFFLHFRGWVEIE